MEGKSKTGSFPAMRAGAAASTDISDLTPAMDDSHGCDPSIASNSNIIPLIPYSGKVETTTVQS